MEKLVVCIMGQNCERFIGMCLESVKDADVVVYCDGGSTDKTFNYLNGVQLIENKYNQKDKKMNGKQRNFYLNYLKKNYPNDWCLCLDADEVVEDLSKIKEFINKIDTSINYAWSVKMRHLVSDLAHEDATTKEHFVLNRLFKINEVESYPEVEHPVLQSKNNIYDKTDCTTIWHLAYIPNMWEIKKRYDNHLKKSNIHTPEFLKNWYYAHLFGQYPKSQFNPVELPDVVLNKFGIDKDELYFSNRGLETKHFLMAKQWIDYFGKGKYIEFGCGKAPFGYALSSYGINYTGIELSKFAVKNSFVPIFQGNILNIQIDKFYDLAIAFDVLEHIDYKDLNKAINKLISSIDDYVPGKLLISVPVIGDPNLENDKTHKIKESKNWWINKFTEKGLKLIPTPEHFLFKEQIMIFEK